MSKSVALVGAAQPPWWNQYPEPKRGSLERRLTARQSFLDDARLSRKHASPPTMPDSGTVLGKLESPILLPNLCLFKHLMEDYDIQITMKYSTVDEYFTALTQSQPTSHYPVYEGDFYPYLQEVTCEPTTASCLKGKRVDHWNGFYSTRSLFKSKVRELLNLARNSHKFYGAYQIQRITQNPKWDQIEKNLTIQSQLASVLTHHDAITGTHSLKTMRDYEYRIEQASEMIKDTNLNILNELNNMHNTARSNQQTKLQQFATLLAFQAGNDVSLKLIRVFNPQTTTIDGKILKTKASRIKTPIIFNAEREPLVFQRMTYYQWDTASTSIKEDLEEQDLYFFVDEQQPLSVSVFLLVEFTDLKTCQGQLASMGIDYAECTDSSRQFEFDEEIPEQQAYLENRDIKVYLNQQDGTIEKVHQKQEDIIINMRLLEHSWDRTNLKLFL